MAAAAERAQQVPGISNLGTIGQKVDQPQLRIQGRLDAKTIAGGQPFVDNALDAPPAGRGLEFMLFGSRPGDIDPAATAITIVDARLLAERGGPAREQLGAPGPQLNAWGEASRNGSHWWARSGRRRPTRPRGRARGDPGPCS